MFAGDLYDQFAERLQVCSVSDPKGNAKAHSRVAVAPVGHAMSDQVCIGHNDSDVIVGDDGRAAQADLADLPGHPADFNAVADGNRPLGQNDQTANKITDDILQAKSQSDANGAGQDRQRIEIDANNLETEVKAECYHAIAKNPAKGELQRRSQMRAT